MKCDLCENEATVHEVTRHQGVTIEKHLCEKCAAKQGLAIQPGGALGELVAFAMSQPPVIAMPNPVPAAPPAATGPTTAAACGTCGLSFAEFKTTGILGCPDCYTSFEAQLSPLIERAHEGATHHVGKVPKRRIGAGRAAAAGAPADAEDRARRRLLLRKQLDEAIRAEQYERAATIRDEIQRLSDGGEPPAGESSARPASDPPRPSN